ncbi:hypothetical protein DXG01_005366 [Tephrocybe rancida]|nr:hypothetical protein DXG01_005366 [Tephrocybe rancida]
MCFWKDAMMWGQLSHPNVLTIYGLFLFRNRVSIVAPWMENGDIGAYLKDNPDAPRPQLKSPIASLMQAMDAGGGLSYLHDNDIIHGDLRGANVLVDGSGRACLADFGIWSVMDADILSWTTQTTTSLEGGSVRWKAPELFDVENDVSARNSKESDVYALGCVYYEIFTGEVPFFDIPYGTTVTLQVRSGIRPARPEPASPSWNAFGMTQEIWTCMEQSWNANPQGRPSAHELVRRLARNLAKDTRPSPDVGMLSPREFRHKMRVPFQMITVKDLRIFLEKSANRRLGTELSSGRLSLDDR